MAAQHKAARFLKSTLIPGITAAWNQSIGSAFHGTKDQQALGKEGSQIRELLKNPDKAAQLFVQGIDYKVIEKVGSITSAEAFENYLLGIRNNHYGPFSCVMGDIAEYYVTQYYPDSDPQQNIAVAEELLNAFFNGPMGKEWVIYFTKKDLKKEDLTDQDTINGQSSLKSLLIKDFKQDKPHLFQIFQENTNVQTLTNSQAVKSDPQLPYIADSVATLQQTPAPSVNNAKEEETRYNLRSKKNNKPKATPQKKTAPSLKNTQKEEATTSNRMRDSLLNTAQDIDKTHSNQGTRLPYNLRPRNNNKPALR